MTLLCQTRQILLIPTLQPFALQGRGAGTTDLTGRVRNMQLVLVFTLLARSAIQSYTSEMKNGQSRSLTRWALQQVAVSDQQRQFLTRRAREKTSRSLVD